MRFILTHHARTKCIEREVSEEEIIYTLGNFHMTVPGHNGGIGLFAKQPGGSTVILWIAGTIPLVEPVIIKTVVKRGA